MIANEPDPQARCIDELQASLNHPEREKYPDLHRLGLTDWTIESALVWEEEHRADWGKPAKRKGPASVAERLAGA